MTEYKPGRNGEPDQNLRGRPNIVPEGLYDGSLAWNAWKREIMESVP
ncbi:MAG: hypothetical protein WBZ19_09735 [Chthoniobacterales bacterium]